VSISDEDIVDLLARARPEGIEVLYDRHGRLAYSVALRILGDPAAAEDVVQEAFMSIWRRSATYRPERGSLRSWVCTIVRNRAIDGLRGRAGRARQDLPIEAAPARPELGDTWDAVAAELERQDVRRVLDRLPAEQRQAIELAYFGGYSQSEISSLLHVPLGTVKGRTRMAMAKLRSALEGSAPEWSPA
jgi:RNA polymerase sigma-70 factor (ECF subfamily)